MNIIGWSRTNIQVKNNEKLVIDLQHVVTWTIAVFVFLAFWDAVSFKFPLHKQTHWTPFSLTEKPQFLLKIWWKLQLYTRRTENGWYRLFMVDRNLEHFKDNILKIISRSPTYLECFAYKQVPLFYITQSTILFSWANLCLLLVKTQDTGWGNATELRTTVQTDRNLSAFFPLMRRRKTDKWWNAA